MTDSLRALLTEIIDYAGLFPPAELSLDSAVRSYAAHRASRDAWMLSRFVCPVGRLRDLEPHLAELIKGDDVFRFSVLLRGGPSRAAFLDALARDLEEVGAFRSRQGARVEVSAAEVRAPADELARADTPRLTAFLDDAAALMDRHGPPRLAPFYEAGFAGGGWRSTLGAFVAALGAHDRGRARGAGPTAGPTAGRVGPAGLKLRCGGVTDDAFPSPEEVAFVIATCRDHGVPMKFTAGLHHPLRHFNEGQGVTMHGFLNVFAAVVTAWEQKLEAPRIQQILEDTSPDGFSFDEGRLSWKGYAVPTERVKDHREHAAVSFGSCSFDEPREDLRAMGLFPAD